MPKSISARREALGSWYLEFGAWIFFLKSSCEALGSWDLEFGIWIFFLASNTKS